MFVVQQFESIRIHVLFPPSASTFLSWLLGCSKICVHLCLVPIIGSVVGLLFSPLYPPVFKNKCLSNPACLLAKVPIRPFMLPGNMQFLEHVSYFTRESKHNLKP